MDGGLGMSRAVVFTHPDPLRVAPPLAIFAGLVRRGEQLTIYSNPTYQDEIEAAAATYRAYDDVTSGSLEVLDALRTDRPDYLLLDAAATWGSVAAERLRLPAVSYRTGLVHQEPCRCGLNLVLLSRALQLEPQAFDPSYRFVGRCLNDGPVAEPDGFPWDELGPDPLIYISPGTAMQDRPAFLGACMEAFGGLPFDVVVAPGRPLESVPPNFLLVPSAPQGKLLDRATLAITDAEAGTVEDCAHAGVPHLMYPQNADQSLLAGRVQELGVGLCLNDADIEGGRLRELAGKVLADPHFCRAAEALSETVRESGGTARACDEILAFIRCFPH